MSLDTRPSKRARVGAGPMRVVVDAEESVRIARILCGDVDAKMLDRFLPGVVDESEGERDESLSEFDTEEWVRAHTHTKTHVVARTHTHTKTQDDAHVDSLDSEGLLFLLRSMYDHFGGDSVASMSTVEMMEVARRVFFGASPVSLEKQKTDFIRVLSSVSVAMKRPAVCLEVDRLGMMKEMYALTQNISRRVCSYSRMIYEFFAVSQIAQTSVEDVALGSLEQSICSDMRRAVDLDQSSFDTARFVIEDVLARARLRKFKGHVYRPVYATIGGRSVFLQAYEPYKVYFDGSWTNELGPFIATLSHRYRVSSNWRALLGNEEAKIAAYLLQSDTAALPSLRMDDTLRSFRNGVYDLRSDSFYPWSDLSRPNSISAAVYADLDFPQDNTQYSLREFETGNWFEYVRSHCPTFYKIISHQFPAASNRRNQENFNLYKEPELCMRFLCAMIGRMFYTLGQIDQGYECFLGLIGHGGTGKSKILEQILRAVPNHFVCKVPRALLFRIGSATATIARYTRARRTAERRYSGRRPLSDAF